MAHIHKVRKYYLLLFLILFALPAHADSKFRDSLAAFHKLDSLYEADGENDPAQGIKISLREEEIANMLQVDTLMLTASINKARSFVILGFLDIALKEYYNILKKAEGLNAPVYEAKALYRMGMVYQTLNDYKHSSDCLNKAKALSIATLHFKDTVSINYELGFNCLAANDDEKGIAIIEQNIAVAKQMHDDINIALGLDNLSNIYFEMNNYGKSLSYLLEILKYPAGFKSNYRKTGVNEHLTELYVAMKQWGNARKYLAETFKYARAINSNDWLFECYKLQSQIDEGTGNFKGALEAHKTYLQLKDSVFRVEYENKIAALSSVYELEKKQAKISLLEKDNQIGAVKIHQQLWQRNAIVSGSVLLIALVATAFFSFMQRKKKGMQIAFSRSLIHNQEAEKQRISQELHDSVGQNILFIKNQLSGKVNNAALGPVMETITVTMEDIRNISKELYPNQLEKYGLTAAVDTLCEKVYVATGIFVSADLQEIELLLSKEANVNFFRIIQESLNNIIKHAAAKAVRITGNVIKNKIALVIMDNGKGFDTSSLERKSQTSYGLINMEERAKMLNGKMELESSPAGTKITIIIPVTGSL